MRNSLKNIALGHIMSSRKSFDGIRHMRWYFKTSWASAVTHIIHGDNKKFNIFSASALARPRVAVLLPMWNGRSVFLVSVALKKDLRDDQEEGAALPLRKKHLSFFEKYLKHSTNKKRLG